MSFELHHVPYILYNFYMTEKANQKNDSTDKILGM